MNTPTALPDNPNERDAWAAEYALGTLPGPARQLVAEALASDPDMARRVHAWSQKLVPLADLVEPVQPPARLWGRVERSLGWAAAHGAADPGAQGPGGRWGWWHNLALWRGVAVVATTASLVLGGVVLNTPAPGAGGQPTYMVVLVAPQDKAPGWVIQANDQRQISLIPLGVFEVPADKALEFWTKADGWNAPVSLGLVKPGQKIQLPLDKLPPLQPNQLFELTLEPPTGSPTGRPTGPIQFIGRAVPVT